MTYTNTNNIDYKRAAGLFYSRGEAEAAVRGLKDAGYDQDRISVVARDADKVEGVQATEDAGNKADEGAAAGALTGGALGGITGLLVGLGALAIPGIGPIIFAGAEATAIATTLAGGAIGAATGGLVGALVGLGIPEEKAKVYNDRVAGGSFLVMVTGTEAEVKRAGTIMERCGVEEFGIYNAPNAAPAQTAKPVATPPRPRAEATDNNNVKLYEERLVADKERHKAGEVSIGKHVETETAKVAVPVEKERIVIERINSNNEKAVAPGSADFSGGEVAHVDIYEESAEIGKEAFVREEVKVRKEVEHETVQAQETLRREELDVDVDGKPEIRKDR
ncbi:MAG: DUF2382 domain-containing protein [Rivularia sp. (in: cyanobacteria)]